MSVDMQDDDTSPEQLDELQQAEAEIEADPERAARTAEHEARMRRSIGDFATGEGRQDPLRARRIERNDVEEGEPTEQQLEDSGDYAGYRRCGCCGYEGKVTYVLRCAACKENCDAPYDPKLYQQHGPAWQQALEERGR